MTFKEYVDSLGVDSNPEHDDSQWWRGYRQAQREHVLAAHNALEVHDATVDNIRNFCEVQAGFIRNAYGRTGPAVYLGFANACEDILEIIGRDE